jgi:hypothetical protein
VDFDAGGALSVGDVVCAGDAVATGEDFAACGALTAGV